MTRAVTELGKNIGPLIPVLAKKIAGFAASPSMPIGAFRYKDWRVVVEDRKITIAEAETEDAVKEVLYFIENIIENASTIQGKVKSY